MKDINNQRVLKKKNNHSINQLHHKNNNQLEF